MASGSVKTLLSARTFSTRLAMEDWVVVVEGGLDGWAEGPPAPEKLIGWGGRGKGEPADREIGMRLQEC